MALKTPNLGLIKPNRGEYENTWDIPVNKNSDLLDGLISDIQGELTDARGTKSTLDERISISLNDDGTIKDQSEIVTARNSSVYGNGTAESLFSLDDRIEQGDREIHAARRGLTTLSAALAFAQDGNNHNTVVSAPTGFLSFTGANVKVDGSVTPVVANINGYRQVIRNLKSKTITGSAGTYYIYLDKTDSGETYLDRSGAGQNNGVVSTNALDGKLSKFSDSAQNFWTLGVTAGDVLEITSTESVNKGIYLVDSVDLTDPTILYVKGVFTTAQTNLNYKLTNPYTPTLGATNVAHAKRYERSADRIYIGRAVFDGTNVTSTTSYAVQGRYEQFFNITLTGGAFTQTVSHNLGFIPSSVQFYGSQAGDYSQEIEPLSLSDMTSSTLLRSVIVSIGDMSISVKNATSGIFYKGFNGISYTSGYLLVVAER